MPKSGDGRRVTRSQTSKRRAAGNQEMQQNQSQQEMLPVLKPASPATSLARKLEKLSPSGKQILGSIDFSPKPPIPFVKNVFALPRTKSVSDLRMPQLQRTPTATQTVRRDSDSSRESQGGPLSPIHLKGPALPQQYSPRDPRTAAKNNTPQAQSPSVAALLKGVAEAGGEMPAIPPQGLVYGPALPPPVGPPVPPPPAPSPVPQAQGNPPPLDQPLAWMDTVTQTMSQTFGQQLAKAMKTQGNMFYKCLKCSIKNRGLENIHTAKCYLIFLIYIYNIIIYIFYIHASTI